MVQEDTPIGVSCCHLQLEADGHPSDIVVEVYVCSDGDNSGAPMYPDSGKQSLDKYSHHFDTELRQTVWSDLWMSKQTSA